MPDSTSNSVKSDFYFALQNGRRRQLHLLLAVLVIVFAVVVFLQLVLIDSVKLWAVQSALIVVCISVYWGPKILRVPLRSVFFFPRLGFGSLTCAVFSLASAAVFFSFAEIATAFKLATLNRFSDLETLVFLAAAPMSEEIFFRGFLQSMLLRALRNSYASWRLYFVSVYLSSLVFFIFHWPVDVSLWKDAFALGGVPLNFGPFFLGIWTGLILVKDRSLFWCVIAHGLANFFAVGWGMVLEMLFSE